MCAGGARFSSNNAVDTWKCSNIGSTAVPKANPYCYQVGTCYAGPFDADFNNRYHLYYNDIACP